MQGATIIDQISGKKKVFIKNQGPSDKFQQQYLLNNDNPKNPALDEIQVTEYINPNVFDLT